MALWLCRKGGGGGRALKHALYRFLAAAHPQRHFGATLPGLFGFPDVVDLTVMADNVLPAVLRAVGVLRLSASLAARIDARVLLPAGAEETTLRAAAVVACERLVAAVRGRGGGEEGGMGVTAAEVDEWLWSAGKEARYRGVERHATRDTYFY
jgi:hypothetical protein